MPKRIRRIEQLETRRCMDAAWQNPVNRWDVDDSSLVEPIDALLVIDQLNRTGAGELPILRPEGASYCDTNGDGILTPLDALLVINTLSRYSKPLQLVVHASPDADPNATGVVLTPTISFSGSTLPDVRVTAALANTGSSIVEPFAEMRSGANGQFSFQLTLEEGINYIAFVAEDSRGRSVEVSKQVRLGDVVLDWNAAILNVVREWTTTSDDPYQGRIVASEPPRVARNLAMIHTAMFDAVNATNGEYEPYLDDLVADRAASPAAAAAIAAYYVASALYPDADEMGHWDATLAESLTSIPDGEAKARGVALGEQVGERMLAARAGDGSAAEGAYISGSEPGDWQRTLPGFTPALLPQWPDVEPFAIASADQFRPPSPPELTSEEYAAAVDEVMQLGRIDSDQRTDDQTEIAIFWADGGGTFTPPGHWNQIAADVALSKGTALAENARLFALLNLAMADAGIAAWDAKYHFDLWRPIDAIRQGDTDGNPATPVDPDWLPLLQSPPFPTYTSGHSTFSGAADAVLTSFFGPDTAFISEIDGHGAPAQRPLDEGLIVTRSFSSFTEAANEAGRSRIYGGIHFNFDDTAGLEAGRRVGTYVLDSLFADSLQ